MPRQKKKVRFYWGFLIFLAVVAGMIAVSAFLLDKSSKILTKEFPNVAVLNTEFPHVRYRGIKKTAEVKLMKTRPAQWASLGEISKVAVGAIIVSEDWAFYQHKGYDPNAIKEAIQEDLEEGRFSRGASTITQQVAKNVFLTHEKSLWRKIKELMLAVQMERKIGKRRILETYLNVAEWGEGIFGIRAASTFYFGKPPKDLTAKEGAFLAMLLPSPKRYSQSFRDRHLTRYASKTIDSIMRKMVKAKFLTEEEFSKENQIRLAFDRGGEPTEKNENLLEENSESQLPEDQQDSLDDSDS